MLTPVCRNLWAVLLPGTCCLGCIGYCSWKHEGGGVKSTLLFYKHRFIVPEKAVASSRSTTSSSSDMRLSLDLSLRLWLRLVVTDRCICKQLWRSGIRVFIGFCMVIFGLWLWKIILSVSLCEFKNPNLTTFFVCVILTAHWFCIWTLAAAETLYWWT